MGLDLKSAAERQPLSVYSKSVMTIEEQVLEKLRHLPPEKQAAVLEFAESLEKKRGATPTRRSLRGLWADLNVQVTEEDIADARREMWGGFPRDLEL